ncbi:hypothetical protein PG993_014164 [Apiospora rasikravindrae]|uniref:Biotrophy-associated secreted protein 2 n=1 Tax=Apiospora rasikravindrae TaxID=990691 RepID=A0ABR1RUB0_9PEZI
MVRISVAATLAFAITAFAIPNHPQRGLAARQAAGNANVGKGDGSQFITGQCASDADCASTCCAKANGQCAARAVAEENGKDGCGGGSAAAGAGGASSKTPTSSAAASASSAAAGAKNKAGGAAASSAAAGAQASASAAAGNKTPTSSAAASASSAAAGGAGAAAVDSSKPGSQNVGKGDGSQFITGQCTSDADCASGCCAKPKGVCSAEAVSNVDGKQGCGFTGTA